MKSSGLIVDVGPHIHGGNSIARTMHNQIIALIPAIAVGVYMFGAGAIRAIAVAVAAAVVFEYLMLRALKKPASALADGSAALTGLLLVLMLPADVPWWVIVVGVGASIVIGKMLFGGLGAYPFNPVIVGWVILLLSWPGLINKWPRPNHMQWGGIAESLPAQTTIEIMKRYGVQMSDQFSILDSFLGFQPGGIGSVAGLALVIGGVFLIARNIISWQVPVGFIAGIFIFGGIYHAVDPTMYASPLFHLVSGTTLFCIFFLAPEHTTSPNTKWGKILFGLCCAALTIVIRTHGTHANGSARFAILLMNLLVPFFDRIRPPILGLPKKSKEAAADA